MSDDQGERSFEPTPQRREQFRKDGRFARSKDAGGVLATAAVLGTILGSRQAIGRAVQLLFMRCHGDLTALGRLDAEGATQASIGVLLVLAAPAAIAAALGATVAGLAQSGAHISMETLSFKPERLNPFPKLGQLFSFKQGAKQTVLNLLRVGLVGYVAQRALLIELPAILNLARVGLDASTPRLVDATVRVILSALAALAGVAVVDYAQSRFTLEGEMKMTRKEMMDETRSQDGDPKLKARMRARGRALARRRSLQNVKKASVVVSNPTHISVALRYTAADPAPVVVAKGHDEIALQIRAEARKHGVPILENRLLARALDAEVPLGHPVPAAHFAAVAHILAFVFRLRAPAARPVRKRTP
jgi:flagellar biosynthesis protein FlhB